MKKFKVIEESRFLNKQGMNEVRGGNSQCKVTPEGSTYLSCGTNLSYLQCKVTFEGSTYNEPEPCSGADPAWCSLAHAGICPCHVEPGEFVTYFG